MVESGVLTLNNCRVTGNSAAGSIAEGGGIYDSGFLTNRRFTPQSKTVNGELNDFDFIAEP